MGVGGTLCFLTLVGTASEVVVPVRLVLLALFFIYKAVAAETGGFLNLGLDLGGALGAGTSALSMMAPVGEEGGATLEVDKDRESLFVPISVDGAERASGLVTVLFGSKMSSTGPVDLFFLCLNWTRRFFPLLVSVVPRMLELEDDTDELEGEHDMVVSFMC